MRLGRVSLTISYVVDLDNEDMVAHAKDSIHEDVIGMLKFDEVYDWIKIKNDPNAKEEDILEFLSFKEAHEEDNCDEDLTE